MVRSVDGGVDCRGGELSFVGGVGGGGVLLLLVFVVGVGGDVCGVCGNVQKV